MKFKKLKYMTVMNTHNNKLQFRPGRVGRVGRVQTVTRIAPHPGSGKDSTPSVGVYYVPDPHKLEWYPIRAHQTHMHITQPLSSQSQSRTVSNHHIISSRNFLST